MGWCSIVAKWRTIEGSSIRIDDDPWYPKYSYGFKVKPIPHFRVDAIVSELIFDNGIWKSSLIFQAFNVEEAKLTVWIPLSFIQCLTPLYGILLVMAIS